MATLRDEKKNYYIGFTYSVGFIKKLVKKNLHLLLNNKSAAKMWTFQKNRFQNISSISIMKIVNEVYNIKLLDCKDVIDYMGCYQVVLDQI